MLRRRRRRRRCRCARRARFTDGDDHGRFGMFSKRNGNKKETSLKRSWQTAATADGNVRLSNRRDRL